MAAQWRLVAHEQARDSHVLGPDCEIREIVHTTMQTQLNGSRYLDLKTHHAAS